MARESALDARGGPLSLRPPLSSDTGRRIHATRQGWRTTDLLETNAETRRFVCPVQSNSRPTPHGGNLRKWLEQMDGLSAMHFAGTDTVTVGMDWARFHRHIPDGQVALVDAVVSQRGNFSVRSRVRGFEEDRHTDDRTLATEAVMVSVAHQPDGTKVDVPALEVATEAGEGLRDAALEAESVDE